MNDDSKNGINERILEGVINLSQEMGRIKGEVSGLGEHIQSLDRRLEARDSQLLGYGNEIGRHGEQLAGLAKHIDGLEKNATIRHRKCSETMAALSRGQEATGKHVIIHDTSQKVVGALWRRAALIVGMVGGIIGIAAGVIALSKCDTSNSHAAMKSVDMKRK